MMASDGWTTQQLVQVAHESGFPDVTARRLETWRGQDLLPRPERVAQAGISPVWLSPPGTDRQLLALCRLRGDRGTADPDQLRLLLWLHGIEQPLLRVKASLEAVLTDVADLLEKEIAATARKKGFTGDPAQIRLQALNDLARQAAGLRTLNTVLPRLRSADGHRVAGFQAMLHMFVEGKAPASDVGTGEDVERTLGVLPRAELDRVEEAGPWHDGRTDLDRMARVVSLPALRAAANLATDEDLLYARRAIRPLTLGLSFFSRLIGGMYADHRYRDNYAGLGLLRTLPKAAYTEPIVLALIVSLRHSELADNLTMLVDTVERCYKLIAPQLDAFLKMPRLLFQQKTLRGDRTQIARLRSVLDQFRPSSSHD